MSVFKLTLFHINQQSSLKQASLRNSSTKNLWLHREFYFAVEIRYPQKAWFNQEFLINRRSTVPLPLEEMNDEAGRNSSNQLEPTRFYRLRMLIIPSRILQLPEEAATCEILPMMSGLSPKGLFDQKSPFPPSNVMSFSKLGTEPVTQAQSSSDHLINMFYYGPSGPYRRVSLPLAWNHAHY